MKRFRFKLQTLLEHRKAFEDGLLAELGTLRREEAEEVARLEHLERQLVSACQATEQALRSNAPLDKVVRCDHYAKATRDDIKIQELTIEAVRERVEAKRLEVIEAMKARQVLEALRDKQERAYVLAQDRAEQNALDDMASVRYARGM